MGWVEEVGKDGRDRTNLTRQIWASDNNGKNYKIAAISNKNLEKIKYNTVQSQTNKIHMAKLQDHYIF